MWREDKMKEYGEEDIGQDGEKSDLSTHVDTKGTGGRKIPIWEEKNILPSKQGLTPDKIQIYSDLYTGRGFG